MKEVSHHLRLSYLNALATLKVRGVDIPVHDEDVPAGGAVANVAGGIAYVIILDQNEVPTDFNKCGIIQDASITLDVVTKFPKGSGGKLTSELISDAIQQVINPFGQVALSIDSGFRVLRVQKMTSRGIAEHDQTHTTYRKIIIYNNKINQK